MTAWQIYLVIQLDSIRGAAFTISLLGFLAILALSVWNVLSRMDADNYPSLCNVEERKAAWTARAKTRRSLILWVLPVFAINAFIPSTKTMAAMLIIPAIANSETIRKEAGDLYDIAKQGLRELASPHEQKPKK